jgi:hypothetical protein
MHTHCRPERTYEHNRKRGGICFGGALIIFGVGYLLHYLGMLGDLRPWQVWPAIPIWGGLVSLVRARNTGPRLWGLVLIAFGALSGAHYLGFMPFDWKLIWPILLIIAGVLFLFGGRCGRRTKFESSSTTAPSIDIQAMLSGREDRVDSQDFSGGSIRCRLGGCKLDLRRAEIAGEEAILNLDIVMGGVEIFIPTHWRVYADISPAMGGIEDKTKPNDMAPAVKRLVIKGAVVMGGVEIKN